LTIESLITGAGTLVVKIGSSLLIDDQGALRREWMNTLVGRLSQRKGPMLIVSSGAIALGRQAFGLESRPTILAQAQAAAAVGQIDLAAAWSESWRAHDRVAAQILLTLGDLEQRRRYLNARATLETLIERRIVPVVNENDTVATEEIRFGDNDRLAARVAQLVGADGLLLLSDVDGLYDADPASNPDAQPIADVKVIDSHIESIAGDAGSRGVGTGGMASKVAAARIATSAGVPVWLTSGLSNDPFGDLLTGSRRTHFHASAQPLAQRKQWLSGLQHANGTLHIDAGAERALRDGGSLLAVGITSVEGEFDRGGLVRLVGEDGEVARGLCSYNSQQVLAIAGCQSDQISKMLGQASRGAVIHRDDIVLARE